MRIFIKQDTVLKPGPNQSSTYPSESLVKVLANTSIEISAFVTNGNHTKFTIRDREDDLKGKNTWYAFTPHVEIQGGPAIEEVKTNLYSGPQITLPNGERVYLSQPIILGGNFTWAEATHNGERLPPNMTVLNGMKRIAKDAQKARDQIGKPFTITSWYRPPAINKRVGGASQSRHLVGDALDILVAGETGLSLARKLSWWPGGMGIYSNMPNLLHLDSRGYRVRWGGA